jgi:hypothetical protein
LRQKFFTKVMLAPPRQTRIFYRACIGSPLCRCLTVTISSLFVISAWWFVCREAVHRGFLRDDKSLPPVILVSFYAFLWGIILVFAASLVWLLCEASSTLLRETRVHILRELDEAASKAP